MSSAEPVAETTSLKSHLPGGPSDFGCPIYREAIGGREWIWGLAHPFPTLSLGAAPTFSLVLDDRAGTRILVKEHSYATVPVGRASRMRWAQVEFFLSLSCTRSHLKEEDFLDS
jgi:hypothetical protein